MHLQSFNYGEILSGLNYRHATVIRDSKGQEMTSAVTTVTSAYSIGSIQHVEVSWLTFAR